MSEHRRIPVRTALFPEFRRSQQHRYAARFGTDTAIGEEEEPGRLPLLRGVVKH